MVVVTHHSECAFEQRIHAISSHHNSGPTDWRRQTVLVHKERLPLEYLVVLADHLFRVSDIAIFVDKFNVRVFVDDIVVGLEAKPNVFRTLVEVKGEVEMRSTMHPLRRRVYSRVLD